MPPEQETQTRWSKLTNWLVGLTSVLVVIPALINAGIDIYGAWNKIPRTESEKANLRLFQKYFGKQPIAAYPLPVKQGSAIQQVKFSIFEEGDVFVEYGSFTQWFPFPTQPEKRDSEGLAIISDAIAQDYSQAYGPYQQSDSLQGGNLLRQRAYQNGVNERQVIDTRTGRIVEQEITPPSGAIKPNDHSAGVAPFAGIDLDNPQLQQNAYSIPNKAKICITPAGSCYMVQPVTQGSPCFCTTPFGPMQGVSR